ncbi:MAG TPA: hypothetical protein VK034_15980 [Enhygromyxa sp.]|nr:hypothetical protein [Enhygromyxa sp.]
MTSALQAYEAALEPARRRLEQHEELRRLMAPGADPGLFHAFSIQWASLSVQLHEPLEQFLAAASRRCAELGDMKLGLSLLHVSIEAIELYARLADDTRALAQLWNGRRLPHLDLTSLLTQPITQAIRRSLEHQREIVLGPEPWAVLAAVFEIHEFLASNADRTTEQATRLLGEEVLPGLRSLRLAARMRGNGSLHRTMVEYLTAHPEHHATLVATGTRTLDLYTEFLAECCVAAFNLSSWQARQHA